MKGLACMSYNISPAKLPTYETEIYYKYYFWVIDPNSFIIYDQQRHNIQKVLWEKINTANYGTNMAAIFQYGGHNSSNQICNFNRKMIKYAYI